MSEENFEYFFKRNVMPHILIVIVIACLSLWVNDSKAQTAPVDNKLSQTVTYHPIPKGPSVFGIFEGRPPCEQLARQLKISTDDDCAKLKCDLILYRDPVSFQPTTYSLSIVGGGDVVNQDGGSYRRKVLEGKWAIVKGMKSNPVADVYQLALGVPGSYFYLLKGDENVLFVLDETKAFRVGNEDFSYTLNRVELVPGNK